MELTVFIPPAFGNGNLEIVPSFAPTAKAKKPTAKLLRPDLDLRHAAPCVTAPDMLEDDPELPGFDGLEGEPVRHPAPRLRWILVGELDVLPFSPGETLKPDLARRDHATPVVVDVEDHAAGLLRFLELKLQPILVGIRRSIAGPPIRR